MPNINQEMDCWHMQVAALRSEGRQRRRVCGSLAKIVLLCGLSIQLMACQSKPADIVVSSADNETAQLPILVDTDLAAYIDPVAGFTGKIPYGWNRVVLSEPDHDAYAISFESPATDDSDVFADYLMVEFLSGDSPQGFLASPQDRTEIRIDGRKAYREKLVLTDFEVGNDQIDLVVFQLTVLEIGYSFGLYVVGETREEERLASVFDVFVDSFEFPPNPMQVSLLAP